MYRKRMSDALQEARAYSLISEVMVFKGGRGMSVSKKDLPVFRAKGWKLKEELEEANMKRLLQALQDKLSKEGGAAGFDDLKKTAKTMGVDLTPDMLKNMPGIMQHRDGDYILETKEEVEVEETELEEAFSKKDFQKLEQSNDHTEAAKKLIDMFGTSDEKKEMNDIKARHEKTGYISGTDYSKRIKLVNRYYSRLK